MWRQGGSIYTRKVEGHEQQQPVTAVATRMASAGMVNSKQHHTRSRADDANHEPNGRVMGEASHTSPHVPSSPPTGPNRKPPLIDQSSPDQGSKRDAATKLKPSAVLTPQGSEPVLNARRQWSSIPTQQYCSAKRGPMFSPASVHAASSPPSPLVHRSPLKAQQGASLGAGLPGMVPTPFFDGGVGQTLDMEGEHGDSSPEEGVGDAGLEDTEVLQLKRLLASVRQRRGGDISGILAAANSRGTPLLAADRVEALASIDSSVRRREERGKAPITHGGSKWDTHAAASNQHQAARTATGTHPHAFTNNQPDPPASPPSQAPPQPQAGGHGTAAAPRT
ncbi:unnamed protein product [Closterium sp. Yama58-4]|nr:unnamed protein product [Closterium sp. Yama58-4]